MAGVPDMCQQQQDRICCGISLIRFDTGSAAYLSLSRDLNVLDLWHGAARRAALRFSFVALVTDAVLYAPTLFCLVRFYCHQPRSSV